MSKKIEIPKKTDPTKIVPIRKLEGLENLREVLVATIFCLSDLVDDLTGYSKVGKK